MAHSIALIFGTSNSARGGVCVGGRPVIIPSAEGISPRRQCAFRAMSPSPRRANAGRRSLGRRRSSGPIPTARLPLSSAGWDGAKPFACVSATFTPSSFRPCLLQKNHERATPRPFSASRWPVLWLSTRPYFDDQPSAAATKDACRSPGLDVERLETSDCGGARLPDSTVSARNCASRFIDFGRWHAPMSRSWNSARAFEVRARAATPSGRRRRHRHGPARARLPARTLHRRRPALDLRTGPHGTRAPQRSAEIAKIELSANTTNDPHHAYRSSPPRPLCRSISTWI